METAGALKGAPKGCTCSEGQRVHMKQRRVVLALAAAGLVATFLPGSRTPTSAAAQSHSAQAPGSVAAIAGQKGGQDIFGAYEPVANWPQE